MGLEKYQTKGLQKDLLNEVQVKSLLRTVTALPVYIGAPPFDNKDEADDIPIIQLTNFIMRMFPHFTPEMVTRAFDFAAAGKLYEEGKRIKITTYGKLMNIELLGSVLRVYDSYLEEHTPILKPIIKDSHLLPEANENDLQMKPIDHYNKLIEEIEKTNELPKFYTWKIVHGYLVSIGKVPETKQTKRRSGHIGSIRQLLQLEIHKDSVVKYLRSEGIIKSKF